MPGQLINLPNGQSCTVTPIFGGFTFKSNELDIHQSAMPPGWTVHLTTEDEVDEDDERTRRRSKIYIGKGEDPTPKRQMVSHRFTRPTLQNDSLFISSVTMPASSDFKGPTSPSRHVAMMLWTTLHWYFHKEAPKPQIATEASVFTPEAGRPKGDWRIKVKKEGIFKGRNILQKLERMGLVCSEDSYVGTDMDPRTAQDWQNMFVSRRAFWQLDPRIFLFTLAPAHHSPLPSASPHPSRPTSPERGGSRGSPRRPAPEVASSALLPEFTNNPGVSSPGGPFASGSHLPTYYPAPPTQYTFTNHIRHPIRHKPPRQSETFYTRYIPSVEQWLSFRVPTLSPRPTPHYGPGGPKPTINTNIGGSVSVATLPTLANFSERMSDVEILNKWMNIPRVNAAWGEAGPKPKTEAFLHAALSSKHSFPVFACWDGKPFGYFEVYWVKEDKLGRLLGGDVGNWTRGLHGLVGEQEFRGPHRVKVWLSALVHFCWLADMRTECVMLEPRVDNTK